MKRNIAVAGAGITGLTCAYALAKAGHRVTVYEAESHCGGLAGGVSGNGYAFDYGPHEFCTQNPELVTLLRGFLGDDFLTAQKKAAQYFLKAYIRYPLVPGDLIRHISPRLLARVFFEVVGKRLKNLVSSRNDYTFRDWVDSRFGSTLYDTYFGPYTLKVWGLDPIHLDARTASSRISFNSVFDLIIRTFQYLVLRSEDYSTIHSPLKDHFFYARGGIAKLPEAIERECRALGVTFLYGHELAKVDVLQERVTGLHFKNGLEVNDFDYFVNTVPLTKLLACMGYPTDLLPLMYRSLVFVNLEVPQRPVTPYTWIYYPDSDLCFQRMSEYAHIDPTMAPAGCSGLSCEISCWADDQTWSSSDEALVARVRQDLDRIGALSAETPCNAHVVRTRFAYPVQVSGFLEIVETLLRPIRRLKNGATTGR